ncbi:hypothetical protein [Streptomyces sp. NPDC048248]|uniref:hypothetical protein n=1 Tax=Streptomyces sp. NPDC048248 TaxID=3365523 RepID=UPI003721C344
MLLAPGVPRDVVVGGPVVVEAGAQRFGVAGRGFDVEVDRRIGQRACGLLAELVAVVDVLASADELLVDGVLAIEGEVPQEVVLCLGAEERDVGREAGDGGVEQGEAFGPPATVRGSSSLADRLSGICPTPTPPAPRRPSSP